jgi:pimeloyl-ACP methyl ester carboxylesterase
MAHGALDAMDPVERAKEVAAMIRQSELHIFEKSGHFPLYTSPEEFHTLLEEFLERKISVAKPLST